jgi:hypothetical protein
MDARCRQPLTLLLWNSPPSSESGDSSVSPLSLPLPSLPLLLLLPLLAVPLPPLGC